MIYFDDKVYIKSGFYAGFQGYVIEKFNDGDMLVSIKSRSGFVVNVKIPEPCLKLIDSSILSGFEGPYRQG